MISSMGALAFSANIAALTSSVCSRMYARSSMCPSPSLSCRARRMTGRHKQPGASVPEDEKRLISWYHLGSPRALPARDLNAPNGASPLTGAIRRCSGAPAWERFRARLRSGFHSPCQRPFHLRPLSAWPVRYYLSPSTPYRIGKHPTTAQGLGQLHAATPRGPASFDSSACSC